MRVGILTVSDGCARGLREDLSGDRIVAWCAAGGHDVAAREVVPDESAQIVPALVAWADDLRVDVILTTGGTGLTDRDVTPESTRAVIEREAPGIAEELRRRGLEATPHSILSRGVAGTRGRTLIVNLPGSPSGVGDGLGVLQPVIEHAVKLLSGTETSHASQEDEA